MTKASKRQSKLWIEALDRAGTSRCFLLKPRAVSALELGSCPAISIIRIKVQRGSADAGSTHAWAEVYVPGAGWITFDPTNRSVGGFNLIPVAVARDIRQAMPMTGSFAGAPDAFQGMTVEVLVTSQPSLILGA